MTAFLMARSAALVCIVDVSIVVETKNERVVVVLEKNNG